MKGDIYFTYHKTGKAIPDHEVEQWIKDSYQLKNWGPEDTTFSTENVVWAAEYLLAAKEIPYLVIREAYTAWDTVNAWSPIYQWKEKRLAKLNSELS